MSGDPNNASLWAEADVFIAPMGTALPDSVSDPFPAAWGLVGLLDGSEGFKTSRSTDTSDIFAWGGVLVKTTRKNFKLTRSFTALEDNPTTRSLVWPGSPAGSIIVPVPEDLLIGFETREGASIHRLISAFKAQVDVSGDIAETESDLTKYPLVATIFPTADGTLFIEQTGPAA